MGGARRVLVGGCGIVRGSGSERRRRVMNDDVVARRDVAIWDLMPKTQTKRRPRAKQVAARQVEMRERKGFGVMASREYMIDVEKACNGYTNGTRSGRTNSIRGDGRREKGLGGRQAGLRKACHLGP